MDSEVMIAQLQAAKTSVSPHCLPMATFPPRETSPSANSEEKRMFSQANIQLSVQKTKKSTQYVLTKIPSVSLLKLLAVNFITGTVCACPASTSRRGTSRQKDLRAIFLFMIESPQFMCAAISFCNDISDVLQTELMVLVFCHFSCVIQYSN